MQPIPPMVIPPQPSISPTPPPPPPVPPAEPPIFPPPPPKKKSFIWLIILVILLLLASTSVLAYQYYQLKTQVASSTPSSSLVPSPNPTPSQDPTANWKTYTASQTLTKIGIDFSIKYPEEWFVNENNPSRGMSTPWVIMTENEVSDVLSRTSPCLSVSGGMWPDTVGMNGVIESQNSHQLILSPSGEKVSFIIPGASENFTLGNIAGIKMTGTPYSETVV